MSSFGGGLANIEVNSIKETLRRAFAAKANEFALILNTVALEISDMKGDIEVGSIQHSLLVGVSLTTHFF